MSHQPERNEKNCLNCGVTVAGRYCQNCGQENIVPKQSVWGLITHFVYDIFHFDGKFFHTLAHLLFKPGFIPAEYISGKRMRYLDPIRMYLFTSAVFFLIFFAINKGGENLVNITGDWRLMTKMERLKYASILHQQGKALAPDTSRTRQLSFLLDTTVRINLAPPDAKQVGDSSFLIQLDGQSFLMEAVKPQKENEELEVGNSWFGQRLDAKWKAYKRKFGDDERAMINDIADSFLHKFPYILFVSLPLFALILKLLYVRRRPFYYSDHAIFTLYHYIFTFILLLAFFLINKINDWLDWGVLSFISVVLFLSGGVYLFIAMKRFYRQKWFKTFVKFLLLNILALTAVMLLMVAFILLSVFQL